MENPRNQKPQNLLATYLLNATGKPMQTVVKVLNIYPLVLLLYIQQSTLPSCMNCTLKNFNFKFPGLPFNGGGAVPLSFMKQEMSVVDRGRNGPVNHPSTDLHFPSSTVQSAFGRGGPSFPGAGEGLRSGLDQPPTAQAGSHFPSPTTQAFANEQRSPYTSSQPHNLRPMGLSGLDARSLLQSPLGKGRFSPGLKTEPSGMMGQRISDIPQQFPYLALARSGSLSGPGNTDSPGRTPDPVNVGGPRNMNGPGHMDGPVRMDGPVNIGNMDG